MFFALLFGFSLDLLVVVASAVIRRWVLVMRVGEVVGLDPALLPQAWFGVWLSAAVHLVCFGVGSAVAKTLGRFVLCSYTGAE